MPPTNGKKTVYCLRVYYAAGFITVPYANLEAAVEAHQMCERQLALPPLHRSGAYCASKTIWHQDDAKEIPSVCVAYCSMHACRLLVGVPRSKVSEGTDEDDDILEDYDED